MAQNYTTAQNLQYGINPFDWSRGVSQKVGSVFDPLGYTGWNKKQFNIDYSSQPKDPGYVQGYDPLNMSLAPDMQSALSGINLNTAGLDKFRNEALRTGPSQWSGLAKNQLNMEEANAREQGGQDARGQIAQARSNLAMRGGLTSGARERVEQQGTRNILDMNQNIARQGGINRAGIDVADEQNRVNQLGALPGMEVQAMQPALEKNKMLFTAKGQDINNQINENQSRNQFQQNKYNQQMQSWAAGQQANATANSGKK